MACYYPVPVYDKAGSPTYRPCGMCVGCRLEYSRQWAIRCAHEASLYDHNCFITLTYNDQNLPKDGSLKKEDFQKFVRRLRKKIEPRKIRYFASGEYGTRVGKKFGRPHYHACLFNYDFLDKKILKAERKKFWNGKFKKRGNSNNLYTSKYLEKIWKKGFCTIGELTFESAGYVARYVMKKQMGPYKDFEYDELVPEFALMSRMPGIGTDWIKKYHNDLYPKDFHTFNGKKMRPNKFYDQVYCKMYPERFSQVKKKRRSEKEKMPYESHLRKYQKEKYRKSVTKSLERKLDNAI